MTSDPLIIVSDPSEPLRLWADASASEPELRLFEIPDDEGEDLPGEKDRLIRSLAHMTSALSSQMSIDEVLQHIVDEAKVLVGAQKIVMSVSGSLDDDDLDAYLVRGSREELPEQSWRKPLERIASAVARTGVRDIGCTDDVLIACVPLAVRERPIGWLGAIFSTDRGLTEDDVRVLAIIGTLAGSSIENARLAARARRALIAEEHDRLAREMHDGISQTLFGVALQMQVATKHLGGDSTQLEAALKRAQELVAHTMSEVRRYAYDMRPSRLERLGLVDALRACTEEMTVEGMRADVTVRGVERELPLEIETCLYRVAQEAVTNAARHAGASSIEVTIAFSPDGVDLRVRDDGEGFQPEEAASTAGRPSLGLHSMRERVQAVGGRFLVATSTDGTVIEAKVGLNER